MKYLTKITALLLLAVFIISCTHNNEPKFQKRTKLEFITNMGTMEIELYNETPKHRDNFVKLVKENAYDGVLFHRVINKFMIQAGDPDSKNAKPQDTLGNGDRPYMVDAEFLPNLFHRKGALGAARDGNPARASSAMQFYIVQGSVRNDSLIDGYQKRINNWLRSHYANLQPENVKLLEDLKTARANKNESLVKNIRKQLRENAESFTDFESYTIPEAHRIVYKREGGTPHLDQNYTVFGQVTKGLEIIDSIAAVETGLFDRPKKDVKIETIKIIE